MAGHVPGTDRLPRHVAIIMDGNGRWAQHRGLPRTAGHHRGVERVREVVRRASDLGLEALTLYAFSTENWNRPNYEVAVLMSIFRRYVVREVDELDGRDVRVKFIGQRDRLPGDLRRLMQQMEARTAENKGLLLQLAVSYGGRADLVQAAKSLAVDVAEGRAKAEEIDERAIAARLWTAGAPDPDLVIRTSGETRVSNFLLWQAAYAEYAFVEECWPEFSADRFEAMLLTYGKRERRYGGLAASG